MPKNNLAQISGTDFRKMITCAHQAFMREHERINSMNVFPVPDGDTGTNMLMTLSAVAKAVSEAPEAGIGFLSKRASDSAIMGARGNSGVILSQIFRGIARGLVGKDTASSDAVAKAFQYGILYAYRAVAKPVEGTILTVAKGMAKGARRAVRDRMPFSDVLEEAIAAGEKELARTPDLLPALKAAGVVDAGGYGLITFLKGCLEGLGGGYSGPEAGLDDVLYLTEDNAAKEVELTHPYCTECVVKHAAINTRVARQQLEPLGDSLVIAEGDQLLKIHIHTSHPGMVLEKAITWGTLHNIKIDNMTEQHRPGELELSARTGIDVISVVAGDGLEQLMRSLGARIIAGGQTMNPPVEYFIEAVHSGTAKEYIVLPNNKNIILAAGQAQKLLGEHIKVIPTTSVAAGLAALIALDRNKSLDENVASMTQRARAVQEASLTVAVRDSIVEGKKVPAGSYIGIIAGKVAVDAPKIKEALDRLADKIIKPEHEMVTFYYGADLSEEQAYSLADGIKHRFSQIETEVYYGGQPHYHLLISVE